MTRLTVIEVELLSSWFVVGATADYLLGWDGGGGGDRALWENPLGCFLKGEYEFSIYTSWLGVELIPILMCLAL